MLFFEFFVRVKKGVYMLIEFFSWVNDWVMLEVSVVDMCEELCKENCIEFLIELLEKIKE